MSVTYITYTRPFLTSPADIDALFLNNGFCGSTAGVELGSLQKITIKDHNKKLTVRTNARVPVTRCSKRLG